MQDQGIHASRHFGFAVAPATLMAMAHASSASGGRIRSAAGAVRVRGTLHTGPVSGWNSVAKDVAGESVKPAPVSRALPQASVLFVHRAGSWCHRPSRCRACCISNCRETA